MDSPHRFENEPGRASACAPLREQPCVPDHQLLHPIAAGAYGQVWLCRNLVGSLRAVKIVRQDSQGAAETFAREFKGLQNYEPISRSHEGLVDILSVGSLDEPAGFFYVMELADALETHEDPSRRLSLATTGSEATGGASAAYLPRTLHAELKSRGALPADEVIQLGSSCKHSVNAIPSPPNPPLPLRSAALTPSPPVEKRD